MRTRIALIIAAVLLLWSFETGETGAKTSGAPSGSRPSKASPGPQSSKFVYINTYRFDPLIGMPDMPAGLRYARPLPEERTAYIVQFKTSITDSMKLDLETLGIRVIGYIPVDVYLVEADARQIDGARELASVRWAGILEPAFKLSPDLAVEFDKVINRMSEEIQVPGDRMAGNRPEKVDSSLVLPVHLRVLGRGGQQEVIRFLKSNGATDVVEPPHEGETAGGEVPRGLLHRLAQQAGVIWIERDLPVSLANDRAAWVVQSNILQHRPEHLRGLSGLGQTITVGDTGIDWDHDVFIDFLGDGTHKPPGASHRKVTAYYVPGDAGGDCHENPEPDDPSNPSDTTVPIEHGTHVAGTAAGDTAPWGVFDGDGLPPTEPIYPPGPHDGIAFGAQLQVQDLSRFSVGIHPPDDLHDLFREAVNPSLRTQDLGEPACPPVTPSAPASFIHTNSWGAFTDPSYTLKSREIDDSMWDNPDLLVLFAAGNRGWWDGDYSIGPHAVAKNSLTVGATMNGEDANDFANAPPPFDPTRLFSSRGPTCDGRIKPDVMAPGRSLSSARGCDTPRFGVCQFMNRDCDTTQQCQETCGVDGCEVSGGTCGPGNPCPFQPCLPNHDACAGYIRLTGTSMATPMAAGAAALVREYYMGGYYPGGIITPSGALIKATLINGAVEMTGAGAYDNGENFFPNNQQGWGRINLDQSLKFQGEAQVLEVHDERVGVSQSQTMSYSFNVTSTCGPLEVTLVWTDPAPGGEINCNSPVTQLTPPTLVNDLDLVVRSPQGPQQTYFWGNVFVRPSSPGNGHSVVSPVDDPTCQTCAPDCPPSCPDVRNNVEGVIVQPVDLTPGTWTVEVTGKAITYGETNPMRQPFALVINCADEDDDDDDDGDPDTSDCAPFDPTVYHGAAELCNGKDENCVGGVDEGFPDMDNDGIKNCVDCDADGDGVLCNPTCQNLGSCPLDCNDLNASIPGPEDSTNLAACRDQVDNDCDGLIDLDCAVNATACVPSPQTSVSGPLSNLSATSSPNNVYQTYMEGGGGNNKRLKVICTFPGVNNLQYVVNCEGFKTNTSEVFSISYANSAACGTTETYTSTPESVSKIGSDQDTLQTAGVGTVTGSSPFLCIKIEDQAGDNQADTVSIDRLFLMPGSQTNCADADGDGYTPSCSGCFNLYCPATDCDDADAQESPALPEGPYGNVSCIDAKDNNCNGLTDQSDHECMAPPPDVLASGQIAGTGTVTGSYTLTQNSDNNWQSLKEAKVSNQSRLVHTWIFDNVPSGFSHKLYIEAQKLATGDDDFLFYYSTDNVTYGQAITGSTVTQVGSDQVLQPAFGSGALSGRIYIRVLDSNPSNAGNNLDTLKVDRLAIKTVP